MTKPVALIALLLLSALILAACSSAQNSDQKNQAKFTTLPGKGSALIPAAGIENGTAIFARTDGPALKSNIYYAAQIIPDGKKLIFSEYYPRQADLVKENKSIIYPLGGAVRFLEPGGSVKTLFRSKLLDGSKRPVMGIALAGNKLYFSRGSAIWMLDRKSGRLSTLAGSLDSRGFVDGRASKARFALPLSFAKSGETLYIADRDNYAVRALNLQSGAVSTVAELPYTPQALMIADGKLFFSGRDLRSIDLGCVKNCKTAEHQLAPTAGSPSRALAKDSKGRIIVVDNNHNLYRFTPESGASAKLAAPADIPQATGAAVLDNRLYMVDGNKRIYSISLPR